MTFCSSKLVSRNFPWKFVVRWGFFFFRKIIFLGNLSGWHFLTGTSFGVNNIDGLQLQPFIDRYGNSWWTFELEIHMNWNVFFPSTLKWIIFENGNQSFPPYNRSKHPRVGFVVAEACFRHTETSRCIVDF